MPDPVLIISGLIAVGYVVLNWAERKSKHQRALENIENLELINRCLDASNFRSQQSSPPWGAPTPSQSEPKKL